MSGGRYARGDQAWGHCKRCGDRRLLKELQYDGQYRDLLVCPDCWDPKHPQEYLPEVHDPVTLFDPTGDQDRAESNLTKVYWPPLGLRPAHGAGTPAGGLTAGTYDTVAPYPPHPLGIRFTLNKHKYNATLVDLEA